MTLKALVLATAIALIASGCSIVATSGAPNQPIGPTPPDCSTSKMPVYFDGVVSAGAVATSLFVGLAALSNSGRREELGYATLFTFLTAIPFSVSGLVGGVRVRSCRKAHDAWRSMPQPAPYPPPMPGAYPPPYGAPPPFPPPPPPQ